MILDSSIEQKPSGAVPPITTIVIPTWNSTATLPRALASIEGSAVSIEIIIVDDHSDDVAALRAIADADSRAKLIVKPARTNAAESRALGLAEAKGDIVMFLDADDWFLPGHAEHRRSLHATARASVIIGRFGLDDGVREWVGPMAAYDGGDVEDYLFSLGGDARSSTISVNKSLLQGTTFDRTLVKHQDWGFVLAAWRDGERIGFDPVPGVVISLAGDARMSSRSNVEASLAFVRGHVLRKANKRRFLIGRVRTSLRIGDLHAAWSFRDALLSFEPSLRERWSVAAMMLAARLGVATPAYHALRAWRR